MQSCYPCRLFLSLRGALMAYQRILSRLLVNLESLGIALDDEDIAAQLEQGYVREVAHFEDLLRRRPVEETPDYLARREVGTEAATPGQAEMRGGGGASSPAVSA